MSTQSFKRGWIRRFKLMMRHTWLIIIAGALLCAGAAALAFYFISQPVTLTIAVGPPSSEDARVVQAMSAHLARDRSSVRLRPIIKEGGTRDTVTAIDKGEADLAIVRRDIGMPKEGLTVAIWRKNVAVFTCRRSRSPQRRNQGGATRRGGGAQAAQDRKDREPGRPAARRGWTLAQQHHSA